MTVAQAPDTPSRAEGESLIAQVATELLHHVLTTTGGELTEVRRLADGASRETWRLEVRDPHASKTSAYVLQVLATGGYQRLPPSREVELLAAVGAAGVPVAGVVTFSDLDSRLGAPFILFEEVVGQTAPTTIIRAPELAEARRRLTRGCGAALAGMARVDAQSLGLEHVDPLEWLDAQVRDLAAESRALELVRRWLDRNQPDFRIDCLVHGDFRNANFVVSPKGLAAVLDWELAHLGDPYEDLGWLTAPVWRYGHDRLQVGGFGDLDRLLDAYGKAGGIGIDATTLHWWQVYASTRWMVFAILSGTEFLRGVRRNLEAALVARRLSEAEAHTLRLILGGTRDG
jgi:aminoglycoside phosphotransferase (APT) family kinase protein